jgi:hypothetical protein
MPEVHLNMQSHRNILLGVLLLGTVRTVPAATVFAAFNPQFSSTVADNLGRPSTLNGLFDLHAGAQAIGALPVNTQVFHLPTGQPGIPATFFPTTSGPAAFREVGRQKVMQLIGGAATWNPPPVAYTQTAKDFTRGIPFTTQTAFRQSTDATGTIRTNAEAVAKATFSQAGATATVNPVGSYASLDCVKVGGGNCTFRDKMAANSGKAGSLVRDPLLYSNMGPGSTDSNVIGLSQSDFRVQNSDPNGMAIMSFEVGTDAFGSDPGALGLDTDGNPRLVQMLLAFLPDGTAWVSVESDSFLSNQQFFDPENSNLPIQGSLEDFVSNRLNNVLQYDPTNGQWTLSRDVSLFGEGFAIPQGVTSMQLDYTTMEQVSGGVPEPGTWGLALAGMAVFVAGRSRSLLSNTLRRLV